MFDFAFSELALIGVVALVVIGPERLPRVARTAGVVVGRLQRYAATVKADIAREVELSELRRVHGEIQDAAQSFQSSMRDSLASAETQFQQAQQVVMGGPQPAPASLAAAEMPSVPASLAAADAIGAPAPAPANPVHPPVEAWSEDPFHFPAPPATHASAVRVAQTSLFSAAEAPPGDGLPPPPAPPA